jgi:hypothetical protein
MADIQSPPALSGPHRPESAPELQRVAHPVAIRPRPIPPARELSPQKDSSELLLIAKPVLGLWKRRSERLCDGFFCDHPGSLDGRERNDGADCAHADECESDCNNQSNGELLAAAHGGRSVARAFGAPYASIIARP